MHHVILAVFIEERLCAARAEEVGERRVLVLGERLQVVGATGLDLVDGLHKLIIIF